MSKVPSQQKVQRRKYELWLKKTNPTAYKEWKSKSHERGSTIHASNVESARNAESEKLEKMQTEMIMSMKAEGKSDVEIDKHLAIWIKTLKIWDSNEKPLSLKEAKKQYELENPSNDNDTSK